VLLGTDFRLPAGQRLEGGVLVIGGNAVIEEGARLMGDLTVLGGSAILDGLIEGDVTVIGPRVRLGPAARIRGDLVAPEGALERASGARVDGRVVTAPRISFFPSVPSPALQWSSLVGLAEGIIRTLLGGLVLLALSLVATLVLPGPLAQNARTLQQAPAVSLGAGLLILFFGGLLILILAITLIGLPLALLALGLLIGGALFGLISLGYLIGMRLEGRVPSGWFPLGTTVLGVGIAWLLWSLAGFLPLCGGPVVRLLILSLAVGSVFLSRFGTRAFPPQLVAPAGGEPPATGISPQAS